MELNYTKKLFNNGVPVRNIDLHLGALKNFYNTLYPKAVGELNLDQEAAADIILCPKLVSKLNRGSFFNSQLILNFTKALKITNLTGKKQKFPVLSYKNLSSEQKGYINELFVINFFLEKSYKWILYRNKKYFSEVDLLFFHKNCYHLIEVKSYSSNSFDIGLISEKQKKRLKNSFLCLQKDFYPLRAHLISVDVRKEKFYIFFDFLY